MEEEGQYCPETSRLVHHGGDLDLGAALLELVQGDRGHPLVKDEERGIKLEEQEG